MNLERIEDHIQVEDWQVHIRGQHSVEHVEAPRPNVQPDLHLEQPRKVHVDSLLGELASVVLGVDERLSI